MERKTLIRLYARNLSMEVPQESLSFSNSLVSLGKNPKNDSFFQESMYNSILESSKEDSLLILEILCSTRAGRDIL